LLNRRITVRWHDEPVLRATLGELGARVDERALATALASVGRRGTLWQRLDEAQQARRGMVSVAVQWRLPVEPLARRLSALKQRLDARPEPARFDFAADRAVPGVRGRLLDVYQLAEEIERAVALGRDAVELSPRRPAPEVTASLIAKTDHGVVLSSFVTRFAFRGAQSGRAQNVARAAARLDGLVLMPGRVMSFNHRVGPRSIDNGFAPAGEIYKGEMRMGIGGGTCQVASTLHAAAFFGGLDVVERSPHSRPSGYIRVGLDATVAFPQVDLRLRNPFDFPILVHAIVDQGRLTVQLQGARRPATVVMSAATIGARPYKRKLRDVPYLAPGTVRRKQHGRRGLTIAKTRRIRYADGRTRVEQTTDVYPPTDEIYYVGPGTDVQAVLPPLPQEASGKASGSAAGAVVGSAGG